MDYVIALPQCLQSLSSRFIAPRTPNMKFSQNLSWKFLFEKRHIPSHLLTIYTILSLRMLLVNKLSGVSKVYLCFLFQIGWSRCCERRCGFGSTSTSHYSRVVVSIGFCSNFYNIIFSITAPEGSFMSMLVMLLLSWVSFATQDNVANYYLKKYQLDQVMERWRTY